MDCLGTGMHLGDKWVMQSPSHPCSWSVQPCSLDPVWVWPYQEQGQGGLCTMSWGLRYLLKVAAKPKPNQVLEGATVCATRGSKAALCHGVTSILSLLSLSCPGKELRHRAARAG